MSFSNLEKADEFLEMWLPLTPYSISHTDPLPKTDSMKEFVNSLNRIYYVHLSSVDRRWTKYLDTTLPTYVNSEEIDPKEIDPPVGSNFVKDILKCFRLYPAAAGQTLNIQGSTYVQGKKVIREPFSGTLQQLYTKLELPYNLAKLDVSKIRNLIFNVPIAVISEGVRRKDISYEARPKDISEGVRRKDISSGGGAKFQDQEGSYLDKISKELPENTILNIKSLDDPANKLFPPIPINNSIDSRKRIQYTKESIYSITTPFHTDAVIEVLRSMVVPNPKNPEQRPWLPKELNQMVVTDATSNCGGFILNLAQNFKTINAVEIDKMTFDVLMNNINVYNIINVVPYNTDYIKIKDKLNQDIVLIDPPWGGVNYKEESNLQLQLSGIDISIIVNSLRSRVFLIVLKAPLNFNLDEFKNKTDTTKGGVRIKTVGKVQYIFIRGFKRI
jgi:predicted RNA methylase